MSNEIENKEQEQWSLLKAFTDARIALGRTGVSMPNKESLSFKMAHANARDAVHEKMDKYLLIEQLESLNHPIVHLHSQAIDRAQYLLRPDLGRKLNTVSIEKIKAEIQLENYDLSIIISDGLSATAVHKNIFPFMQALFPLLQQNNFTVAPFFLVEQARVAISDEIGVLSHSKLSIILLGERPGLSSPDSLGAYLTYDPKVGNTDAQRNCISNIREKGLSYQDAANKLILLIKESIRLKLSGVSLKDNDTIKAIH
jgi:ethanolamine ammonia-lyase small subunit